MNNIELITKGLRVFEEDMKTREHAECVGRGQRGDFQDPRKGYTIDEIKVWKEDVLIIDLYLHDRAERENDVPRGMDSAVFYVKGDNVYSAQLWEQIQRGKEAVFNSFDLFEERCDNAPLHTMEFLEFKNENGNLVEVSAVKTGIDTVQLCVDIEAENLLYEEVLEINDLARPFECPETVIDEILMAAYNGKLADKIAAVKKDKEVDR